MIMLSWVVLVFGHHSIQKQHIVTCVYCFSDLESQDWYLAMAMQFQEGDECQVMNFLHSID